MHEIAGNTKISRRLIGYVRGREPGPTVVFIAGIHGNEPTGVYALRSVLKALKNSEGLARGSVFALAGNLPALQEGVRYIDTDLNRMWTHETIHNMKEDQPSGTVEEEQMKELFQVLGNILKQERSPFYFFDLHTTSCETIPFMTVNDMRLNRKFASLYPLPMILGIEEYLEGPLLSYLNELGYISFGFEGGQHENPQSIRNHEAFIYLTLFHTGLLDKKNTCVKRSIEYLTELTGRLNHVYEIFYRYKIGDSEQFEMLPGHENFNRTEKGTPLAFSNGLPVEAREDGMLFMPLYQARGEDGFFMVRKIPGAVLSISDLLRNIRADRILPFLPGVTWESEKKDVLVVNRKTARFFARELFHILGYRNKVVDKYHIRMKNREAGARVTEYEDSFWQKREKHRSKYGKNLIV